MRLIRVFAGAIVVATAAMAVPAGAEAPPEPAAVARSLVEHYVLPRHRAFAEATAGFDTATESFCGSPGAETIQPVEDAFHRSVDAWLAIEPLQFGPIVLLMRSPRLYFWPDPGGRAAQDVREFVASGRTEDLAEESFHSAPVSLQGLPAAEVLLFEPESRRQLLAGDEDGKRRCALLRAIAGNVHEMAAGLAEDWESGDEKFTEVIAAPGPDNPYFASQDEVTVAFLKAVNHALRLALDTRLKPVLGAEIGAARPDRAEARHSGRSLRNIVAGLEAAQAIYLGEGGMGLDALAAASSEDKEIAPLMRKAFDITIATAQGIGKELPAAVLDPGTRPQVEKLATQIQALRQLVGTRLAAALGLSVGFNALDGD